MSTASLSSLEIYSPSNIVPTGADIATVYGNSKELELQFRAIGETIHVTDVASDSPEWTALDTDFTVSNGSSYFPDVLFTPHFLNGVSEATFTVYSDAPDSPHQFTVYGARVSQITPTASVLTVTSIDLPNRLRLNPVRDELYAQGWEGSWEGDPQGQWLIRLNTTIRQETAALQFPYIIRDYGVTTDGRWLYVATDFILYTIDLDTFQIVDTFIPPEVSLSNATLHSIGVFSNTLAFVGTNPGYASGGPVYQWNPRTGSWGPAPFCPIDAARPKLEVSADYTTVAGLCNPYYSPTTAFIYQLEETVETWPSEERWTAAVSWDGQRVLSHFYGNKWVGSLIMNERGDSDNIYIHTTNPYLFSLTFGPGPLAYAVNNGSNLILEVNVQRGIQTRRIAAPAYTSSGYYTYIPSRDSIIMRDNWLYAALWGSWGSQFYPGEIVAMYIPPFDTSAPSSKVSNLPAFSEKTFTVRWSGTDIGPAELRSYDVQYRDGPEGVWTDWLSGTSQTSATFTGEYSHTYYFRCRARDYVDNLEPYPEDDGDTSTYVYRYALPSRILGNRDQPIALATVQAMPSALNTDLSDIHGNARLYFDQEGTYDVRTVREGFGSLPPMKNVFVTDTIDPIILYLPPDDDQIINGGFETGDLTAWNTSGEITCVLTTTAHTGDFAAMLGGPISPTLPGAGPWNSAIEQEIVLSPSLTLTTLSLLYQVAEADPISDTFQVSLIGTTQMVTYTLPLTSSGWTHQWWDMSMWKSPALTLRIEWYQAERTRTAGVILDEVSMGSAIDGSYPVYLPLALRDGP